MTATAPRPTTTTPLAPGCGGSPATCARNEPGVARARVDAVVAHYCTYLFTNLQLLL